MRKHLLESKNQKAKHREWRECLLVVSQGEFKMFGLPGDTHHNESILSSSNSGRLNMLKSGGSSFVNLADSLSKSLLDSTISNGSVSPAFHDGTNKSKYGVSENIGIVCVFHANDMMHRYTLNY